MSQILRTVDERGRYHDAPLKHGPDGNYQAIGYAINYVQAAAQDESVRALALRIVANVKGHDVEGELDALYTFCRDSIRYRRDPEGQERVQSAQYTIKIRAGDCLDKAILFCALAGSLGYVSQFALLQQFANRDGSFNHVFARAKVPNGWRAYDPTPEEAKPGWQGEGIRTVYVPIWTPAEQMQLAGLFSTLIGLGGAVLAPFTGGASLAIGSAAAGIVGQHEAASAQQKQIGAAFEKGAGDLVEKFRTLESQPAVTAQDYQDAAQGLANLEQFAQQYDAVKYVHDKWASDAYGPALHRRLDALQARAAGGTSAVTTSGAGASSGAISPLLLIGGGLAALYFFSTRSSNG